MLIAFKELGEEMLSAEWRFFLAQPVFPKASGPGSWAIRAGQNVSPQSVLERQ